ncbi:MAG: response regulator [Deltaproteobacteria bacterium]|nr:response regulator [Deltaproteobacteria bacterium]
MSEEKESGNLLVVDDNEMNRDMLSRRLERRGFTVLTAEDGYKALALIAEKPFDLVLLDIMMPGIDGVEVLKRLREKYTPSDLPVIMVTAKDSSEDVVQALKVGANDYVTKPIDFPVVLARTTTQLTLKRAQEQLKQKSAELEKRNAFIRKVFGRYLTDQVVDSLLETPEGLAFGGEKRKVTILMSDLRGFSSMSERLGPEKVVLFLNHYLGLMAEVITGYQGTIDEFIGDAVLAIFGAPVQRPDDAERAVACALAMQRAMEQVNAFNREHGVPDVEMGIGINTGEVVVGNIGSDKRAKYGVVGSHVNLAGRIETYTVGGQVLVADTTAAEVGDQLLTRRTLKMEAKGMKDPITLHDVMGLGGRHNLTLPDDEDPPRALAIPVDVGVIILEGKHLSGAPAPGQVLALSRKSAWLATTPAPVATANLKLHWHAVAGGPSVGEAYAKVMDVAPDGRALIRFTSVTPEVTAAMTPLLE